MIIGVTGGLTNRAGEPPDRARHRQEEDAGTSAYTLGRAGHSIDQRQLHGAGPNLDAIESRDDRVLLSGTACSVEPGVYIPGAFGVRSEVNVYLGDREILITPRNYQRELIIL